MKAHSSFTVRTQLPEALAPLQQVALNLRWAWDDRSRRLFRWVDSDLWEKVSHDPVRLLATVPQQRLAALTADPSFMGFLHDIHKDLERYLAAPAWLQLRGATPLKAVAYFSPEFGISEALPQYSGGLGVLAGDHLKAASALRIPLTGVGLFYRQGYFRQEFDEAGLQVERYPILDAHLMAMTPALMPGSTEAVRVTVDLSGTPLHAKVWKASVGRITLYLLDADIEDNSDEGRAVTDRLYGGGEEHRMRQEILLGVGGVRALRALGVETQVFHSNEGHAGFLGLERVRELITQHGLTFAEAIEAARAGTVFTTHTPVPAGIDRFPRHLMEKYFGSWVEECGVEFDELMELGREPGSGLDAPFNMAMMGLRMAGGANGVSKLHGAVSRRMFADLWPGVPEDEIPIGSVTNGVHALTWVSREMSDLFERYVLPDWSEAPQDRWNRIYDCPDDVLWRVREENRARLVGFVRSRLRAAGAAKGRRGADLAWCDRALDATILTVGFSRRFATYKRAAMLLSDPERLSGLLLDPDRPMQLVFAGKAHPADHPGKELMRQVKQFAADPLLRHRIVFVDNYDIGVARMLYQGSDVWLNTPRRPMEACGTSGEKATLNGALNCSILDGWWDEMYRPAHDGTPGNGWAIVSAESALDDHERDRIEANALFELLEREVVPLFYDRPDGHLPSDWVRMVKTSLATLGHDVMASRMVKDYTETLYEPAARRADAMNNLAVARELANWKARARREWSGIKIVSIESDHANIVDLGASHTVVANVDLGSLSSDDVDVQLVHGSIGLSDEIERATITAMTGSGVGRYVGTFECGDSGWYGFTVRVVPRHRHLGSWAEVATVTSA